MRLTLNIEKRYAYAIMGLLVIVGGAFIVNGLPFITEGTIPNPGHDIQAIMPPSPCTGNQVLAWNDGDNNGIGKWYCKNDITYRVGDPLGTPASWTCTIKDSGEFTPSTAEVTCSSGTMISGGCESDSSGGQQDLLSTYPINNGWSCMTSEFERAVKAYVYCCE